MAHGVGVGAGVGQASCMDYCLGGITVQAGGSTYSTASIQASSTVRVIFP